MSSLASRDVDVRFESSVDVKGYMENTEIPYGDWKFTDGWGLMLQLPNILTDTKTIANNGVYHKKHKDREGQRMADWYEHKDEPVCLFKSDKQPS